MASTLEKEVLPARISDYEPALLDELCATLEADDTGALALVVELFPTDAPPAREWIALSHPSRDPAHLMGLIEPKLERVRVGFGVDRLMISICRSFSPKPS